VAAAIPAVEAASAIVPAAKAEKIPVVMAPLTAATVPPVRTPAPTVVPSATAARVPVVPAAAPIRLSTG